MTSHQYKHINFLGIASVFATQGIEENLGIATFGEQTGVIQHMTNDYDKVLEALGN